MSNPQDVLREARVIAVVGLSADPRRPSNRVAAYMQGQGYRIIPVNPTEKEVMGEPCYATLDDVPEPFDLVNIFRRAEHVPEIVEAAIRKGAKAIWMQEGIVHPEAARQAEQAGLRVVMDHCLYKEHRKKL